MGAARAALTDGGSLPKKGILYSPLVMYHPVKEFLAPYVRADMWFNIVASSGKSTNA